MTYRIPSATNPATAAASLAAVSGVAEAKPIGAHYLATIPNDEYFGPAPPYSGPFTAGQVQWDMYYTQMPAAWDITKGDPSVRIAIIDTGYDANNSDICAKVVGSAVFDNVNGVQDTAADAQDDDGHGSAVSGVAASVTDNVNRFAGVGWNVELLEVRVFKQPTVTSPTPSGASSLDIASAIDWAVAQRAKVINISLGAAPPARCDPSEQSAISNALNAKAVVVVASGNDSSNILGDPANCLGVIAVGASGLDDVTNPISPVETVAGYSNYAAGSRTWGLIAPGGNPVAAQFACGVTPKCDALQWISNNYSTTACCPNSRVPNFPFHQVHTDGTSMAAPHVAGVAALMFSKDPAIAPAQLAAILQSSTDDVCGGCPAEGAGRLNALKALIATP